MAERGPDSRGPTPKMTLPVQYVLHVLLEDPDREMYGLEISEAAGLASGTIHPILARLEAAGWVTSRWEEVNPSQAGRPRRRYYQVDPNCVAAVRAALARKKSTGSVVAQLRPNPAGGSDCDLL